MNKLRWGKFYWSDWSDDPALAACSLAAQGLWMRLLCIAAQGTPYGHVTVNGKPPDLALLARLVRCKAQTVAKLIAELERRGVAKRAACGCLVSSRMEADGILFGKRKEAANSRWHKENGSVLHMQNSDFASCNTEAEADANTDPPRSPPKGGNGAGAGYRNGFTASWHADQEKPHATPTEPHHDHPRVVAIPRRADSG